MVTSGWGPRGCQNPRITQVGNALPDHGVQPMTDPHQSPECHIVIPWIAPGMGTPPLECLTILSMEKFLGMSKETLLMSSGQALIPAKPTQNQWEHNSTFPKILKISPGCDPRSLSQDQSSLTNQNFQLIIIPVNRDRSRGNLFSWIPKAGAGCHQAGVGLGGPWDPAQDIP